MADFKVKLIGYPQNAQTLVVAAALGCFEEKSAFKIMNELLALPRKERLRREKAVLKNSFGRGHGSVGDQVHFSFSIQNLPRAATFELCLPEYLEHLQQSLRRAKASRGFHLPKAIRKSKFAGKVNDVLSQSFSLYREMKKKRIPGEDARFILPLYTKTNIFTTGNARELCHLWYMAQQEGVPSVVTAVVEEMISQAREITPQLFEDFGFNYEPLAWYSSAQLYALKNKMTEYLANMPLRNDVFLLSYRLGSFFEESLQPRTIERAVKRREEAELSNLKGIHFEFLAGMSLTCLHQAIRQRTWNHRLEPIYHAVKAAKKKINRKERMIIPPSIKRSEFRSAFQKQHQDMIDLYFELVEGGIPEKEAIGVIPHSLKIYTAIHLNGWNVIHSIGKRTCVEAQWEIRQIAWQIAKRIKEEFPALGRWAEPQCITYGKCPEPRDCGYYKRKKKA